MEGFKKRKLWFPYLVSTLFVLLFVYAATSKLLDFQKFKVQLGQSPILTTYANWLAWGIPTIELVLALMLLGTKFRLLGMYGALGLMSMFTTYILLILNFSEYIPCSCGGILENMDWHQHLVFNMFFVGLAMTGIIFYQGPTVPNEIE